MQMTNQNENRPAPAPQELQSGSKKPYRTPELLVHGRVDQITKFLLTISGH
jgi:hypothetical protein